MSIYRKRLVEQVTGPSEEPISLSEAKQYIRISNSNEDTQISSFIAAARRAAEEYMGRSLMLQQWKLAYDGFPPQSVRIPYGPIASVQSVSIVQVDETATPIAGDQYYISAARDMLVFNVIPCGHRIEIVYNAGYLNAVEVAPAIRQGILVHTASLYENRDTQAMPEASKALYSPYREVRL